MKENDEEKALKEQKNRKSFKETVTLMMRKKWLSNTAQTIVLVVVLVAIFLAINLFAQSQDIPEIDVTKNKIYTLSDESKKVIEKIDKDVEINIYGIEEDSAVVSLIKQYARVNEHISYSMLSESTNYQKVQKYELTPGYTILLFECGDVSKIIDTSYEFYSYDNTTGQEVDLTEQKITNSLVAITADDKPNVYFTTGHNEYEYETELGVLSTYLQNETYNASTVNLITTGKVPDDCDLLVILSPVQDFMESEVNSVLSYIDKGGNIIITSDVGNLEENYTNLTKIYDCYGVTLENKGYIYETDSARTAANAPNIFIPTASESSDITYDIYAQNGQIWLVYAGRIKYKSEEELAKLNVEKQDLLTSSEESLFISNLSTTPEEAAKTAEKGSSVIATLATKTLSPAEEGKEDSEAVTSQALIMANGSFITDYKVESISNQYPLSYLGNNKDFMLNAISELTAREDTIKIRKDMSTSTYNPTEQEHMVVLIIIFAIPVLIIVAGIVVWNVRRRKR